MFRKHVALIVAALVWALGLAAGFRSLLVYAYTPGSQPASSSSGVWPVGTGILPAKGRACLLVFLHPQCPCSHATVQELAEILAQRPNLVDVHVLFLAPPSQSDRWVKSTLWGEASAISGIHLVEDVGGAEARLFGAATSGQSFLYAPGGRLLFKGGITAARGHAGANPGSDSILSLVQRLAPARSATPVFGCSLQSGAGW